MTSRTRRALATSTGLHLLLVAALAVLARATHPREPDAPAPPDRTEFDLVAPPSAPVEPTPAPVEPAPRPPEPSAAHANARPAALAHSAIAPSTSVLPSSTPSEPSQPTQSPTAVPPTPAPAPSPAPSPQLRGLEVLTALDHDAERAAASGVIALPAPGSTRGPRDLVPREQGTPESRARAASQGYVDAMLAETQHTVPAGMQQYYWYLRRRMQENWRPAPPAAPSLVRAAVSTFVSSVDSAQNVARRSLGPLADGPGRAAADALDSAHPNSPGVQDGSHASGTMMITNSLQDIAEAGATRARVEVELDQDATGRVVAIRVAHPSRVQGFDREAMDAVRAAVPLQTPIAMPGGRRSRWVFEVTSSRDMAPAVGFSFDETTGWFEPHIPGLTHTRARIQLLASRPLGT